MTHRRRIPALVLSTALAVSATIATNTLTARAADTSGNGHPVSILAMGDSYTAGNGAGSYYGAKGCRRSHQNYAEDFAALLRAKPYGRTVTVKTVACSGDTTDAIEHTTSGRSPQVDAVTTSYDLILLTLGGDDVHFADIVKFCLVGTFRDGANCGPNLTRAENAIGDGSLTRDLTAALVAIHRRADPRAKIVLLGYPYLEGDPSYRLRSGHGGNTFIAVGKRIRALTDAGDNVQRGVVNALDGSTPGSPYVFLSVKKTFAGPPNHELYAQKDNPQRWFIQPEHDARILSNDIWYHPNPKGWMAEAKLLAGTAAVPKTDRNVGPIPGSSLFDLSSDDTHIGVSPLTPPTGGFTSLTTPVNSGGSIYGLVADAKNLYWTDSVYQGTSTIQTASRAGGTAHVLATASTAISVGGLAIAGGYLYWTDSGGISRVRTDGRGLQTDAIRLPTQAIGGSEEPGADGLATDGTHLYFSRCYDGTIGRVGTNGTGLTTRFVTVTGNRCPQALATGGGRIYWAELGLGSSDGYVGRAWLDGTDADPTWADVLVPSANPDDGGPFGLAADDRAVYWTHLTDEAAGAVGNIGRIDADTGSNASYFVPNTNGPLAVG